MGHYGDWKKLNLGTWLSGIKKDHNTSTQQYKHPIPTEKNKKGATKDMLDMPSPLPVSAKGENILRQHHHHHQHHDHDLLPSPVCVCCVLVLIGRKVTI